MIVRQSLSRRLFLAAFCAQWAATAIASPVPLKARMSAAVAPPVGPPIVGPAVSWNTTTGFGGSLPTEVPRTTAKAILQWHQPSKCTFNGNYVIGCWADAGSLAGTQDGLDSNGVVFNVGGTNYAVTTPSLYVDTDEAGQFRARWGYWITLRSSDFTGISAAGRVRILASATPNDTTMQRQVIGTDTNLPLELYPRTNTGGNVMMAGSVTVWDSQWLVGATQTYATVKLAMMAAAAAGKVNPLVLIKDNGLYELEDGTWAEVTGGLGNTTIAADVGVTATVRRSAMPATPALALSTWEPRWANVEFRNVTVDYRNWYMCKLPNGTTYGLWHNACRVTNSIGLRDTNYWFNGFKPEPQSQDVNTNGLRSRFTNCTITYLKMSGYYDRFDGNQTANCPGGIRNDIKFLYRNYEKGLKIAYYAVPQTALTVSRAAGGATIEGNGSTILLKVGATTVATYAQAYNLLPSQIAADINANTATTGCTAVFQSDRWNSTQINNALPFGPIALSSTPVQMYTWYEIHTERGQIAGFTDPFYKENMASVDETIVDSDYTTNDWNYNGVKDWALVNYSHPINASNADLLGVVSHGVWRGVSIGGGLLFDVNSSYDGYCKFEMLSSAYTAPYASPAAGTWATNPRFINTLSGLVNPYYNSPADLNGLLNIAPNGVGSSGNVQLGTTTALEATFTDAANGNYIQIGAALSNLHTWFSPNLTYDGLQQPRAVSDVPSGWSKNSTVPTWRV